VRRMMVFAMMRGMRMAVMGPLRTMGVRRTHQ